MILLSDVLGCKVGSSFELGLLFPLVQSNVDDVLLGPFAFRNHSAPLKAWCTLYPSDIGRNSRCCVIAGFCGNLGATKSVHKHSDGFVVFSK